MVKWSTQKKGLRLPLQNKKATFNRQYQESCWICFFFNSKPRQNYTVDWTSEKNTCGVSLSPITHPNGTVSLQRNKLRAPTDQCYPMRGYTTLFFIVFTPRILRWWSKWETFKWSMGAYNSEHHRVY